MRNLVNIANRVAGAVLVGVVKGIPEGLQGLKIGQGRVGGMKRRGKDIKGLLG